MNMIGLPASAYAAQYLKTIRPELNWQAMKDKLGEILKKYNDLVKLDRESNPNSKMMPLAVSMEQTAKNILWLFMKKFSEGKSRHGRVKFTYSYLAKSVGKEFRAPAVITVTRHIERLLAMPYKFIKSKVRSTLGIPGQDVNCIEIELDPRIIIYKNPALQKAHEEGVELSMQPKIIPTNSNPITMQAPASPFNVNNKTQHVQHVAQSLGGAMNDFFAQFSDQQKSPNS